MNINDCLIEDKKCKNNGTCHDLVNDVKCDCMSGYKGKHCEINIDECSLYPVRDLGYYVTKCWFNFNFQDICGNRGYCNDGINDYHCDCQNGWEGKNCEKNIDECASDPCRNGGTCKDAIGHYTCECLPGYHGNDCEKDVNECDSYPCQNQATCINLENNYQCQCLPGFQGENCEININDCEVRQ